MRPEAVRQGGGERERGEQRRRARTGGEPDQPPQCGLAAPEPPARQQGGGQVSGRHRGAQPERRRVEPVGGVRRGRRLLGGRVAHGHPGHAGHAAAGPEQVEEGVQPQLADGEAAGDRGERAFPPGPQRGRHGDAGPAEQERAQRHGAVGGQRVGCRGQHDADRREGQGPQYAKVERGGGAYRRGYGLRVDGSHGGHIMAPLRGGRARCVRSIREGLTAAPAVLRRTDGPPGVLSDRPIIRPRISAPAAKLIRCV